jgi:anti-sigma-K factor RskA
MSSVDSTGPEPEGDDIVAAEYVLGVLPADERATATRRIDSDGVFARLVDKWEVYFAPLAAAYQAIEAPAGVKPAIDRRLFAIGAQQPREAGPGLLSSLGFWRALASALVVAFAVYVAYPLVVPPVSIPPERLIASIAPAEASGVQYLAVFDPAAGEVSLSRVSGEPGANQDFELWMVEGQNAPISMGVIPQGATARLAVSPETASRLGQGDALAISREPLGGSPTGAPTAVVAAGALQDI